jgi:hypothetical protein
MTNTPLVTRVDHHVHHAAQALDVASTALIRAQELASQDTTGTAPARLAQATTMLRGNLRMLADMLTSPQPPTTAAHPSPRGHRRSRPTATRADTTRPDHSGHPGTATPEAQHGRA